MMIVLLAPSGAVTAEVARGWPDDADVSVVSWTPLPEDRGVEQILVAPPRGLVATLGGWAMSTTPGRIIRRLTALDPGSQFWRATWTDPSARGALSGSDIIVALERDALFAAWKWARRGRRGRTRATVVSGLPAARATARRVLEETEGARRGW